MYACLHCPERLATDILLEIARQFSPVVEQASENTVLFPITPLRQMIGSPHQIAAEISRAGYEQKLAAHLAIAANPDTAILLAENFSGVTLVTPGEEKLKLGPIPLAALFRHGGVLDQGLLDVMYRWGLESCEDLAALPPLGVAERLGKAGTYLLNLACGNINRPLRVPKDETSYEDHVELEYPLGLLEPLLFLFSRSLSELCGRMRAQSRAARIVTVEMQLEGMEKPYRCELEFPVPVHDSRTILKLLQLHLERHSPEAAIQAFTLRLEPVEPKRVQGGIFLPPTPQADKLQVTLARIKGMVGPNNAGTPALLNTHRPDAFALMTMPLTEGAGLKSASNKMPESLRLAIRLFRPALPARVKVIETAPRNVVATGVRGKVLRLAGPWKTSGEWWATTFWCREEWDVELDDGALYRIYQDGQNQSWYVHGVYD